MSGRYERLRAAVVEALDAEIGDDVVALRQLLLDALDDECEVEFVEAMDDVDGAAGAGHKAGSTAAVRTIGHGAEESEGTGRVEVSARAGRSVSAGSGP